MARMIPSYVHRDIKSSAEKKIFAVIKEDQTLEKWSCFHSLGLSKHNNKFHSEIDFLLVGPWGIICLEVKGGSIKRDNGMWTFSDKYGRQIVKRESPFEQALSAMMSLKSEFRRKIGNIADKYRFGYGVIFPDIDFNLQSPEWDSEVVYDIKNRLNPFSFYLSDLMTYWNGKIKGDKKDLNQENLRTIQDYLRGNFERVVPLWVRVEESEDNIAVLTENQFGALDSMADNKRVLFKGPAGTGKTMLAAEQARRLAAEQKRVLFICFNVFLGKKLEVLLRSDNNDQYVKVATIHKFFYEYIKKGPHFEEFEKKRMETGSEQLFDSVYPEFFIKSFVALGEEPFDALIVDEGQDILRSEFFTALDFILKEGLKGGQWSIYYDSNNQGRLYNNFDEGLIRKLTDFGATAYNLHINCRNTQPIAIQTSVISGFKMAKTLLDHGEKVEYYWYESLNELEQKICDLISRLIKDGIRNEDITIVFPGGEDDVKKAVLNWPSALGIREITINDFESESDTSVKSSSIQAFKGLENKVVILVGIERMHGDWTDTLNYVGMSRAKDLLFCLFDKKIQNQYQEKIRGFIESFN